MYKIRSIQFINHPTLKNLKLDFCGSDRTAVDTVILAGENGTGKSTILNYLYGLFSGKVLSESELVLENNGVPISLSFKYDNDNKRIWVADGDGMRTLPGLDDFKEKYPLSGIYSDVDINFHAQNVSSVTSLNLDESKDSRKSSTDLPRQVKQLIIDVQALDDAELAREARKNPLKSKSELQVTERMPRFTKSFACMFNGLTYDRIENKNGHKEIFFKKYEESIPIDSLSSGEKQIVYRGCFLLKDINATSGALVFIDEPEISLHPNWQLKIMDYYKGIFSNETGKQTSQIFAVTHSPFIIHNENRCNDKVIVLTRDDNGNIFVKDKPEYYKCTSTEVVSDAFSLTSFSTEIPTVYLEGRTDEMYFNRAVEVYNINVPFQFKWIGYLNDKGQDVNTGDKSLDAAFQFLASRNFSTVNICLKDCDTNQPVKKINHAVIMSIPAFSNSKNMKKGIENALVLDEIDLSPFYSTKTVTGDYGEKRSIQTFEKIKLCEFICEKDDTFLKKIFSNLKDVIDKLDIIYKETL